VGSGIPFSVCAACQNSPLCDRCGHPRGDHRQVFIRGETPECARRISDFQSLSSSRCDCPGFRPIEGPLRDASFAAADEEDPPPLQLRIAE